MTGKYTGTLRTKRGILQMRFSYKDAFGNWRVKEESTKLPERGNKRRADEMLKTRLEELNAQPEFALEADKLDFLTEMEKWLDDVMPHAIRENTLAIYKKSFNKHIKAFEPFKGVKLSEVTAKLIQGYVNEKAKTVSADTVLKHYSNIHKFLDYCCDLELLERNPATRIKLPKKKRNRVGMAYTADQLKSLCELFVGDVLHDIVAFASIYGLRRSEIAGLNWAHIDMDSDRFIVCHTAVTANGKILYVDETKSEASRRTLPLTKSVKTLLTEIQKRQAENKASMGAAYTDSGYVFTWDDGTPIKPEYISNHFADVLKRSSLPKIRFHDLRHSVATLLHSSGGCDLKDIQTWLGHADISTTANIYSHIFYTEKIDMAEKLDAALFSAPTNP